MMYEISVNFKFNATTKLFNFIILTYRYTYYVIGIQYLLSMEESRIFNRFYKWLMIDWALQMRFYFYINKVTLNI